MTYWGPWSGSTTTTSSTFGLSLGKARSLPRRASLRLSQPTVSAQLRTLEEAFGERLFHRTGRSLELTEMGKLAFRYADEIFTVGQELKDVIAGRTEHRAERLVIGVSDLVPKLVLHRLIAPALAMEDPPRITCREDKD